MKKLIVVVALFLVGCDYKLTYMSKESITLFVDYCMTIGGKPDFITDAHGVYKFECRMLSVKIKE